MLDVFLECESVYNQIAKTYVFDLDYFLDKPEAPAKSKTMGDIIKELRLKANMTQEELGSYIGVQKSAIRKYECGRVVNIPRASIEKMAKLFRVSPSYLLGFNTADKKTTLSLPDLSDREQQWLDFYHRISDDMRIAIMKMMASLEHMSEEKKAFLLEIIRSISKKQE